MNKTEMIAAIADKANLTKKDAEKALKAFTDTVAEELANGNKVQLVGFATGLEEGVGVDRTVGCRENEME